MLKCVRVIHFHRYFKQCFTYMYIVTTTVEDSPMSLLVIHSPDKTMSTGRCLRWSSGRQSTSVMLGFCFQRLQSLYQRNVLMFQFVL